MRLDFFILTRLLKTWLSQDNQLAQYSVLDYLQNATLTQWLSMPFGKDPPFMVTAFWSLNYEVQFYAVVGIFLLLVDRTGRASVNAFVIALTGISFIWALCIHNSTCGWFMEFWPVFGLGCLVFMRLCQFDKRWMRMAVDGFLVVVALVCLLARSHHPAPVWIFGHLTEALMIGSCFSLLLIVFRPASVWIAGTIPGRIITYLGLISYSLYLIHQFNLNLARTIIGHILPTSAPEFVTNAGMVAFHIALATAFWFCCERPFLNSRISQAGLLKSAKSILPASIASNGQIQ